MGWRVLEFFCEACDHRFDYTAATEEHQLQVHPCELCGEPATRAVSAPSLQLVNFKNADYKERNEARLKKRSVEHWNKKGKDEAVDRERMQMKNVVKPL